MAEVEPSDQFDTEEKKKEDAKPSVASQLEEQIAIEREAHKKDFIERTGMRPIACYRLVVLSMVLRIIGGTWITMVFLEYVRYYIINDINTLSMIETATESPLSLLKAFMFPYWGVVADRVSRKQVLALASITSCVAAWSMTMMPSMYIFVCSRCLSLIADINGPIRAAILRDLFSAAEWEHLSGGVTGIKSHMAFVGTFAAAAAVAVGMGLLSLGDVGLIGLENEYSKHKADCEGKTNCVESGGYSWQGDEWKVDGLLRVLMIMGAVVFSIEALLLLTWLPETLNKDGRRRISIRSFAKETWREMGGPWNNLRVFATTRLRQLTTIRFIHYTLASGGSAIFMCWYRRHQLDTLTMYTLGTSAGVVAFLTLLLIIFLVNRFGDLQGIWIPANAIALLYGISVALIPKSHWRLSYVFFPLLGGPSATLAGFTPELLAKLIPPDVQGTFQTAKAFLFDLQRAILVWPWLGLLLVSEDLPYPLDCLPIWMALFLGCIALYLTVRQVPNDPRDDIKEGRALDDFWTTPYARGTWYQRHGGHTPVGMIGPCASENSLCSEPEEAPKPVVEHPLSVEVDRSSAVPSPRHGDATVVEDI